MGLLNNKTSQSDLRVASLSLSSGINIAGQNTYFSGIAVNTVVNLGNKFVPLSQNTTLSPFQSMDFVSNLNAAGVINITLPSGTKTFVFPIMTFSSAANIKPQANDRIFVPSSGLFKIAGVSASLSANSSAWFVYQSGLWSPYFLNGTLV